MFRLKANGLRARLSHLRDRFLHQDSCSDDGSTALNHTRSKVNEPAIEHSTERTTPSVPNHEPPTNEYHGNKATSRDLSLNRSSVLFNKKQNWVDDVGNECPASESALVLSSEGRPNDEKISRDLWKEAFETLLPATQADLRKLGYEPDTSKTQHAQDLNILVQDLQEKRELCEKRAWKYKTEHHEFIVRDYAAKCATWVQFIGDLVVPFAPSQAAGPWGLIKAFMKIPVLFADQMLALLGTVERVLQVTHRGRVYETIYATGNSDIAETLRKDLVNVYQAILELLGHTMNMFSKSTLTKFLAGIFEKAPGLFSDLAEKEEELAMTAQACESQRGALVDEEMLQHLQVIQGHLPRIETQVTECLERLEEKDALDILDWISLVKYGTHHNTARNKRTPGTGKWLLTHRTFREWEDSSSTAVLWLRGSPGVGKAVPTSRVVDHVQDTLAATPNDEGFAYFYCDKNEDARTRPLAVAQSFVRQLSATANKSSFGYIQSELRKTHQKLRLGGEDFNLENCRTSLLRSLNLYPRTTLVLNAFDECDPASREDMMELFEYLISTSKRPVKLFIASRPDGDIQYQFRSRPNIEIQATDNRDDIEAYISQQMPKLVRKNGAMKGLETKIATDLLEGCQGMFQWVFLQLEQLGACISREAILDCLGKLPTTLDEMYDRLYEDMCNCMPQDLILAQRAFMWVLAARKPLSREDLLEAIRIDPDLDRAELCTPIAEDCSHCAAIFWSLIQNRMCGDCRIYRSQSILKAVNAGRMQ